MAGPITWRNINAPDFTGSAAILESGSQALQGGLDKLMQLGKDYQARQENAWEKGAERNNNAIIQDLLSAKTVEEYDGIMGGLKERMAAMGGQVNATDITQRAIQGRVDLQNRTKTNAEFAAFQLSEQWKPVTSQVESLIAANQHDKAAEVLRTSGIPEQLQSALWRSLEQDQQSDSRYNAEMLKNRLAAQQSQQAIRQSATEFGWKADDRLIKEAIKSQTSQINNDIDSGLQSGKDPSVVLLDAEKKAREWNAQNPHAPVDMDAIYERYGKRFGDVERLDPIQERRLEQRTNEAASYFDSTISSLQSQVEAVKSEVPRLVPEWARKDNEAISEGDTIIDLYKTMRGVDGDEEVNINDAKSAFNAARDEIYKIVTSTGALKPYMVDAEGRPIKISKSDISTRAAAEIVKRAGIDIDWITGNDLNDEGAKIATVLSDADFAKQWADYIKVQVDADKAVKGLTSQIATQEELKNESLYQLKETALNEQRLRRQQRNN